MCRKIFLFLGEVFSTNRKVCQRCFEEKYGKGKFLVSQHSESSDREKSYPSKVLIYFTKVFLLVLRWQLEL